MQAHFFGQARTKNTQTEDINRMAPGAGGGAHLIVQAQVDQFDLSRFGVITKQLQMDVIQPGGRATPDGAAEVGAELGQALHPQGGGFAQGLQLGGLGVGAGGLGVGVLTGAVPPGQPADKAPVFCAGADLGGIGADAADAHAARGVLAELFRDLWALGKPTIARVRGYALAGGLGLALHRQMAAYNYGGIATVLFVILVLIIAGEVISHFARKAVI